MLNSVVVEVSPQVVPRRIYLIPIGSAGDVHPFVGIGLALKKRGHCVTVITNDYFQALIEKAGLDFIPLGTAAEFRAALDDPRLWDPIHGFEFVCEFGVLPHIRPLYELIKRLQNAQKSIFVGSVLAVGARIAQEKLGIPFVTVHLQPSVFQSVYDPPVFPRFSIPRWWPLVLRRAFYTLVHKAIDRVLGPSVNGFRAELGLPPIRRLAGDWWHSSQRVIGLFPEWFAAPQKDWPPQTRLTGFPLFDASELEPFPTALDGFLKRGDAPLVFTPGSAMRQGKDFFKESLQACEILGRRGVFVTRFPEQLPPHLPPSILSVDYVPFSQLLSRAAAFVHHGGIGTTAQALAAGVPQLITPFAHDQPDNAARVERLGCGLTLMPHDYRAPIIVQTLQRLWSEPELKKNCAAMREKVRASLPLPQVCALIEAAL